MPEGVRVPPGWPHQVHPPEVSGWERTAVAWMLDLCPADYRGQPVLTRHPLVLAHLAAAHVEADLAALGRARATARTALADVVAPQVLASTFEAMDVEHGRLLAAQRAVGLVDAALRGHRHVPRL